MKDFGKQFKKELGEIRTDRDLLDRTLERVRAESERSVSEAAKRESVPTPLPSTRKEPRRSRVVFLKTAVALAAVALVTGGAIFFVSLLGKSDKAESYMDNAINDKQAVSSPESELTVMYEMAVPCDAIENSAEDITESRDPDLIRLDDYETLLAQMRRYNREDTRKMVIDENAGTSQADGIGVFSQDYSETNIQTAGVDEADIIKNDGNNLYYLVGNRLLIFDIHDPSDIRPESEILLTAGDFGTSGLEIFYDSTSEKLWLIRCSYSYRDYGYDESVIENEKRASEMYFAPGSVTVDTYDVRDPSDPVLLSSFSQEGNYLSSRRIGDTVYLVTVKYTYGYRYDTPDVFPAVKTGENDWSTVPARDVFVVGSEYIDSFTIVSAIGDPDEGRDTITQAVAGTGSTVYASADKLFVTGTVWESTRDLFTFETNTTLSTKILSFSIADGDLTASAAGTVPGSIINQYSMDQRDGYLRIATTSYDAETFQSVNNVFVLDDQLDIFSSLEGLAPGENIYSVRFDGDRIYLVTFVRIDPLFVIDASDPGDLRVLGELKIPGFSNYLHPVGDHLLLGIGQATRDDGNVTSAGLKLALFDITDPENPVERSVLVYGTDYGYSEVEYNPKALMVGPGRDIFGLPLCFDKPAGDYGSDYMNGYLLVRVDPDDELVHEYLFENVGYYGNCRGLYTQDAVFIVSGTSIDSFDIDTYEPLDSYLIDSPETFIVD